MTDNVFTSLDKNIYNSYLKTSRRGKGFTPRKDFSNINDEKYNYIKKISKFISKGNIDIQMFFEAPYQIYDDRYIDLKFYSTFAAISAYRKYIQQIELTEPDNDYNLKRLRESIKFIYEKCKNNNLSNIQDYLTLQTGIYPDFLVDLKKDNISFYSLVALNLLERNIIPEKKVVEFMHKNFYNILSSLRTKYVYSSKIKPLSIKLIKTINDILK